MNPTFGDLRGSFSPCGRRWREAPDEGSRGDCGVLAIAYRKGPSTPHPTPFGGHLLPQGEKDPQALGRGAAGQLLAAGGAAAGMAAAAAGAGLVLETTDHACFHEPSGCAL